MKREFDAEGVRFASFQARVFEESLSRVGQSSPIFVRRAMKSAYFRKMDFSRPSQRSLDVDEAFALIEAQYGSSDYGRIKFEPGELHWIGWMYRYICYTRGVTSSYVYSLIKPDYLRRVYYVYHTQSEEWAFANILESLGLKEWQFDINEVYKDGLRRRMAAQSVSPKSFNEPV